MDLSKYQEFLSDEMFAELESGVDTLKGQRDKAINEQIQTRRGLKSKITNLELSNAALLEKLGVESVEALDDMPDIKGVADTFKQDQIKIKRLEGERDAALKERDDLSGKYLDTKKKGVLAEALSAHDFVSSKIGAIIQPNLVWEGDDLLYKQDDGNLVSVSDGVTGFAKSNPELIKPSGAGGAGVRGANAGSNGETLTMARADFEQLAPAKQMEMAQNGVVLN